jgi:hypothetical protein
MNELIHATGTKGCSHDTHDSFTSIDVAQQLTFALTGVNSLFEEDNPRLKYKYICIYIKATFAWIPASSETLILK